MKKFSAVKIKQKYEFRNSFRLFEQIVDAFSDIRNLEARIRHDSCAHTEYNRNSSKLQSNEEYNFKKESVSPVRDSSRAQRLLKCRIDLYPDF